MSTEITSETQFAELHPNYYVLETDAGKWLSNTQAGSPGKGEVYFSSKVAGALLKNSEQRKMR